MVKPSYNPSKIGSQSRKTGIVAKSSTKRDHNNMEDLDDFFDKNGSELDSNLTKKPKQKRSASNSKTATSKVLSLSNSQKKIVAETSSESEQEPSVSDNDSSSESDNENAFPKAANPPVSYSDSDIDNEEISFAEQLSPVKPRPSLVKKSKAAAFTAKLKTKTDPLKKSNNRLEKSNITNTSSQKSSAQRRTASINKKTVKRTASKVIKPPKQALSKSNENKEVSEPIRKSSRVRVPPLAFWKNEKVVYEYNKDHVPSIKNVITLDEDEQDNMPALRTSKTQPKRSAKSATNGSQKLSVSKKNIKYPNTDWFNGDGHNDMKVYDIPGGKKKVTRTIAWAPNKEVYSSTLSSSNDRFKLAILFAEEQEFAASGMLEFPVKGFKSTKATEDTYFIFYVVNGVLRVTISDNVFTVTEGCSFEIPMGNKYSFVNIGDTPAKMFFVQSKYVNGSEEEEEDDEEEEEEEED